MSEYLLPFQMEIVPITKLMLVNFERRPDEIYNGLEFQYLQTKEEGSGYRMIAYRMDKFVDVFDEESLQMNDPGAFEVCGYGLKNYTKTQFMTKEFVLTEEGLHVEFSFYDVKNRLIDVRVIEHSKRKSRSFDMIAPIGVSSKNPQYFPLYTMYQFDFVRKKNTEISVKIDGITIIPDSFPMLKDGQKRYFTRYGYDCELVNIATKNESILPVLSLDQSNMVVYKEHCFHFERKENSIGLSHMELQHLKHKLQFCFLQPLPNIMAMKDGRVKGEFKIQMDETMGSIGGEYQVKRNGMLVEIELIPTKGWKAVPNSFVTKMLFNKRTIFCKWPKSYRYHQTIDLETKQSSCGWERIMTSL